MDGPLYTNPVRFCWFHRVPAVTWIRIPKLQYDLLIVTQPIFPGPNKVIYAADYFGKK
jgi:hypothetical protein